MTRRFDGDGNRAIGEFVGRFVEVGGDFAGLFHRKKTNGIPMKTQGDVVAAGIEGGEPNLHVIGIADREHRFDGGFRHGGLALYRINNIEGDQRDYKERRGKTDYPSPHNQLPAHVIPKSWGWLPERDRVGTDVKRLWFPAMRAHFGRGGQLGMASRARFHRNIQFSVATNYCMKDT